MAMNGYVEKRRRLILVEIVEGVLVDFVPVAWVAAQNTVVGIIGVRKRHDGAVAVRCAERQIDVVVVAVPEKSSCGQQLFCAGGRRQDRAEPAFRPRAGDFPEYVDAAANNRLLLLGVEIRQDVVLGVGMGGDLMAGL